MATLRRRCVLATLVGFFGLLALSPVVRAQGATVSEPGIKRIRAVRVPPNSITLDGRLTDEAWARATPATDFVQQQPAEGRATTHASEVRFLYDDTYLY